MLAALEGLPGTEACSGYRFMEERGPWEAEARRLEKELPARCRQQQQRVRCFLQHCLLGFLHYHLWLSGV